MCDNAAYNYSYALKFALIAISLKQCVKKMSIFMTLQYNLFLIAIKLKKCAKSYLWRSFYASKGFW